MSDEKSHRKTAFNSVTGKPICHVPTEKFKENYDNINWGTRHERLSEDPNTIRS